MLNWIKITTDLSNVILFDMRLFLWDVDRETATVGKFQVDPDYGLIVNAYNDYYEISCFSHYAIIEPPND